MRGVTHPTHDGSDSLGPAPPLGDSADASSYSIPIMPNWMYTVGSLLWWFGFKLSLADMYFIVCSKLWVSEISIRQLFFFVLIKSPIFGLYYHELYYCGPTWQRSLKEIEVSYQEFFSILRAWFGFFLKIKNKKHNYKYKNLKW